MALVQCNDCGTRVSDRAEACPRCGKPPVGSPARRRREREDVPIVSPWVVYICGSVGKLRLFFLFTALLLAAGGYVSLGFNSWVLIYTFFVGFAVSFFLTFALPSRETGIAMIIASKFTRSSPQKIRDVLDTLIGSKDSSEEEKS